jgi:hypothetical protein
MKLTVLFASLFLSSSTFASLYDCPDSDDSLACQQKSQIEAIWVDMNQSANTLVDDIMTFPESAVEAGCLDNIRSIDISILTIDPLSIWTDIYSSLKDELISQVCSAVEDKVNELSAELETDLEAPLGLGSISITSGYSIDTFSELTDTRVKLTNSEAKEEVVESVLGDYSVPRHQKYTEKAMNDAYFEDNGTYRMIERTEDEEKIETMLNLNRLWSTDEDEDGDDDE